MPKFNVSMEYQGKQKAAGWYFDDGATWFVKVLELDEARTEVINRAHLSDADARSNIDAQAASNGWTAEVSTQDEVAQTSYVARPSFENVFTGTVSASQDVHGIKGSSVDIQLDNTTRDATHVSHADGDVALVFPTKFQEYRITAILPLLDITAGEKATYGLHCIWLDSSDVVQRDMLLDVAAIEGDAAENDSGILAFTGVTYQPGLNEKLKLQVEVIDGPAASPTGAAVIDVASSQVFVDKVGYQVTITDPET